MCGNDEYVRTVCTRHIQVKNKNFPGRDKPCIITLVVPALSIDHVLTIYDISTELQCLMPNPLQAVYCNYSNYELSQLAGNISALHPLVRANLHLEFNIAYFMSRYRPSYMIRWVNVLVAMHFCNWLQYCKGKHRHSNICCQTLVK